MWRIESLLWSFVANALALWVVIVIFSGVTIGGIADLFEAAVVFGLLNTFVKPLLKLVTLPLAVITLRLIWFLVAMLMLEVTTWIVSSFNIHGFFTPDLGDAPDLGGQPRARPGPRPLARHPARPYAR